MKKIIPIFLTVCLFLFVVFMWLSEMDDNKWLKEEKSCVKKATSTPIITCPEYLDVEIYEPENIYWEVVERNCEDCPVCESVKECEVCDYKIWEGRVNALNSQLREALNQYKMNCR